MRQAVKYATVQFEEIGTQKILGYHATEALLRHFGRVFVALLLNGERVVEALANPGARLLETIDAGNAQTVDPNGGIHLGRVVKEALEHTDSRDAVIAAGELEPLGQIGGI